MGSSRGSEGLPSSCVAASARAGLEPGVGLRVASWNIGLRGLDKICCLDRAEEYGPPDVHGIRRKQSYGTIQALLGAVDADIVCLQEVKLRSLGAAERRLALCDGWESFFALSGRRYAGVATFCRAALRPRAVAEGLTLPLVPSPLGVSGSLASTAEERIDAKSIQSTSNFGDTGEAAVLSLFSRDIQALLESEGRCLITLHGNLAIFNIYAPAVCSSTPTNAGVSATSSTTTAPAAAAPESRSELKLAFLTALEVRARAIRNRGFCVCLIGDFNATVDARDSAHEQASNGALRRTVTDNGDVGPSRRWLWGMLGMGGAVTTTARAAGELNASTQPAVAPFSAEDGVSPGAGVFAGRNSVYESGVNVARPLATLNEDDGTDELLASLGTGGFADVFRQMHPEAQGAYTCFHVAAGCDTTNHGSRLDFALVAPPPMLDGTGELLSSIPSACSSHREAPPPALALGAGRAIERRHSSGTSACLSMSAKSSDPEARRIDSPLGPGALRLLRCEILSLQGSDHLPIRLELQGIMLPSEPPEAHPASSSRRLGSQTTLSNAFAKRQSVAGCDMAQLSTSHSGPNSHDDRQSSLVCTANAMSATALAVPLQTGGGNSKIKRGLGSTPSLRRFFAPVANSRLASIDRESEVQIATTEAASSDAACNELTACTSCSAMGVATAARSIGAGDAAAVATRVEGNGNVGDCFQAGEAWRNLRKRMAASTPRCLGHGEACQIRKVKKAGPNQGREFWTCPRPEGPKSRRECNCGFFVWNDEWRKRSTAAAKRAKL